MICMQIMFLEIKQVHRFTFDLDLEIYSDLEFDLLPDLDPEFDLYLYLDLDMLDFNQFHVNFLLKY